MRVKKEDYGTEEENGKEAESYKACRIKWKDKEKGKRGLRRVKRRRVGSKQEIVKSLGENMTKDGEKRNNATKNIRKKDEKEESTIRKHKQTYK